MPLWDEWARRWNAFRRREQLTAELEEEIALHIEQRGAARTGRAAVLVESSREAWGFTALDHLLRDLRFGLRGLVRQPGFTLLASGTLAIAIGAGTAIFSLIDAVLLRPLPFRDPAALVYLYEDHARTGFPRGDFSPGNFRAWREGNTTLEGIGAYYQMTANFTGDAEPERLDGQIISPGLFPLLGVQPAIGRLFTPDEETPGRDGVVILSHGLWQRRFGGDASLIGRKVLMSGRPRTVVGVMPRRWQFVDGNTEFWVPLALEERSYSRFSNRYLHAVGRLKPGVTLEAANQDLRAIAQRLEREHPRENEDLQPVLTSLRDQLTHQVRPSYLALLGGVACLFLIACANTSHLVLTRTMRRGGELAVRASLGAGAGRLIRQLLTENLMLASIAGAAGLLIAQAGFVLLRKLIPGGLSHSTELALDYRVFGFLATSTLAAALLSGWWPAWRSARSGLRARLAAHSARTTRSASVVLIGLETAMALVLLTGAGLLIQSFFHLRSVDPGVRPAGVLTMLTALNPDSITFERRNQFYDAVLERVQALPGVESAAYMSAIPLMWKGGTSGFEIEGRGPARPGQEALHRQVTPAYFQTLGIPILRGRGLADSDSAGAEPVVVVNQTLARHFFPGEEALGQRIRTSEGHWMRIAGIVADVREMGLAVPPKAIFYVSPRQVKAMFSAPSWLAVRVHGDPAAMTSAVRRQILAVAPQQTISNIRPLPDVIGAEWETRELYTRLLTAFAAVALLLACLGIYGVTAYSVAQRTKEFGIRLALGSPPAHIVKSVCLSVLRPATVGAATGAAGAVALSRLAQSLLFGVPPSNHGVLGGAALLMLAAALAACYWPSRQVFTLDPIAALRRDGD
ncbi:MAG: ABC transporter permease [Acidobacteria bacterium]|nr:ABC transporter permease [Acidobacteriota bacterium]